MASLREDIVRAVYRCFRDGALDGLDELLPPDAELVQDPPLPGGVAQRASGSGSPACTRISGTSGSSWPSSPQAERPCSR